MTEEKKITPLLRIRFRKSNLSVLELPESIVMSDGIYEHDTVCRIVDVANRSLNIFPFHNSNLWLCFWSRQIP